MIYQKTPLDGAYILKPEKIEDERGFFARIWDGKDFEKHELSSKIVQCSISFNKKKGTIRGMHYQLTPYEETKIVRCTKGSIFDVIIDLRKNSKTFKKYFSIELSSNNHKMLYVPGGFAHGFQTLENNSEVFYQISQVYKPDYSRGVKWDDNTFQIKWPLKPTVVSQRDSNFPEFKK